MCVGRSPPKPNILTRWLRRQQRAPRNAQTIFQKEAPNIYAHEKNISNIHIAFVEGNPHNTGRLRG